MEQLPYPGRPPSELQVINNTTDIKNLTLDNNNPISQISGLEGTNILAQTEHRRLEKTYFCYTHHGKHEVFVDKKLSSLEFPFIPDSSYDTNYFVSLHRIVSEGGRAYPGAPNYLGARLKLSHTGLNIELWRQYLQGYEDIEICQFLEFGFPLGLREDPPPLLKPASSNHGSAYTYYSWLDKFVCSCLKKKYIAGPFLV